MSCTGSDENPYCTDESPAPPALQTGCKSAANKSQIRHPAASPRGDKKHQLKQSTNCTFRKLSPPGDNLTRGNLRNILFLLYFLSGTLSALDQASDITQPARSGRSNQTHAVTTTAKRTSKERNFSSEQGTAKRTPVLPRRKPGFFCTVWPAVSSARVDRRTLRQIQQ